MKEEEGCNLEITRSNDKKTVKKGRRLARFGRRGKTTLREKATRSLVREKEEEESEREGGRGEGVV